MAIAGHTARAINWIVATLSAVPGLILFGVGMAFHEQDWAASPVRGGLLLLAIPAAFLLDEPAAGVVSATPRNPWWDLSGRLLGLLVIVGFIGTFAWSWNWVEPTPQAWLLALLPACLALLAVAGAALLRRLGRATPGDLAASFMGFAILGMALFNPAFRTWEVLPFPGQAGPGDVTAWVVFAGLAGVVLLLAPSGRGPRPAIDG
jgi:hypothetical protein